MTNDQHNVEQVYICEGRDAQGQQCGQLHRETTVAVRPVSKVLYCRTCQSEALRLCTESMTAQYNHYNHCNQ